MSNLKAVVVRPSGLSSEEIALWRSFLDETPAIASPFMSPFYSLTAEKWFVGVSVAKLERAGRVVGFFPFQYRSRLHQLLKIGQRVSGDLADYFGVIGSRDLELSGDELVKLVGLNVLLFDHLDERQQSYGLLGGQPEIGLRIDFPNGPTEYWEGRRRRDKKFVQDTERRERKLIEKYGPLRFVFRHQSVADELERLIAAKRSQYSRTEARDVMASKSVQSFLKEIALTDDSQCRAILSTLHAGETWVCSHFGLACGGTLHLWFPVYNPDLRAFSPGRLLVKALIDTANETGLKRIDRGAGDTPAKRDFATSEHIYFRGVWQRRSITTLTYRAGLSAAWRIRGLRKPKQISAVH